MLYPLLDARKGSLWKSLNFCSTFQDETPLELYIDGRNLFLATEDHGIRVIEYNVSSGIQRQ